MQSMPQSTRTVIALSSIGMFPIEIEKGKRKLLLVRQLQNLNTRMRIKHILISRPTQSTEV